MFSFIKGIYQEVHQTYSTIKSFLNQEWSEEQIDEIVHGILGSTSGNGELKLSSSLNESFRQMAYRSHAVNLNQKRLVQQEIMS